MSGALAWIPYGGYWSTPFARWQGAFAELHSLQFAGHVAKAAMAKRNLDPGLLDFGVLGFSVPQQGSFYGLPWVMGQLGAPQVGGPSIMQACATAARCLQVAAGEVAARLAETALVLTCDRVSNGPHIYYPQPSASGGTGAHENWVLDNFARDPFAGVAMVDTAENVAAKHGVERGELDDVTLMRAGQYAHALADDAAFHRRFMDLPFEVPDARFCKTVATLAGDEGIYPIDAVKVRALKPVREGGTSTHAGQTHPADGNAGAIVCTRDRARVLSRRPEIEIALLGFGQARVEPAHMPEAPVPAAWRALAQAGLSMTDIDSVKSHNPFAVNDVVFARATGFALTDMNNFGCSLIWGHPQAPTGLRSLIELIEELVVRGGGRGMFQGCAAGDTAMAVIIEVRGG